MTRTIPEPPQAYRDHRAQDATAVVAAFGTLAAGQPPWKPTCPTRPHLSRCSTPPRNSFGPADILINNATGWLADTFAAAPADRLGRSLQPVTAETWTRQFTVDAMGAAL
jgi:3-oxoacyl-[acyl-carrier protein] reductase